MCVNLIQPAVAQEARAGFITMESMGYPYFSGSNTLCTAATMMDLLELEESVTLETPNGVISVEGHRLEDESWEMTCLGSPAYVVDTNLSVELERFGLVTFDLVFSGALYAVVQAVDHGFALDRSEESLLIDFAHDLVSSARTIAEHNHPELGKVAPLPFVHFEGPLGEMEGGAYRSRTATFVFPDVICRSPTGTGTAARLALMHQRGICQKGEAIETTSPRGNSFVGRIVNETQVGDYPAIRCTSTGRVFTLARSKILVNPEDWLIPQLGLMGLLEQGRQFF
jgi:proline racemase